MSNDEQAEALTEVVRDGFSTSPFIDITHRDAQSIAATILASDAFRALVAEERDKERADWSSWLDGWTEAVGPNPPTVENVADALRAGPRPFGCAKAEGPR